LKRIACGQRTVKQLKYPKSACFTGFLNNKATLLPIQTLYQKQSGNMCCATLFDTMHTLALSGCWGVHCIIFAEGFANEQSFAYKQNMYPLIAFG